MPPVHIEREREDRTPITTSEGDIDASMSSIQYNCLDALFNATNNDDIPIPRISMPVHPPPCHPIALSEFPRFPSMISLPPQIPSVLQHAWPHANERAAAQIDTLYSFQRYIIRVDGVRSERHMCLLTCAELPIDRIPPLHVYPHGIRQREVNLQHVDSVQLTDAQLTDAERFHQYIFQLLKELPNTSFTPGQDRISPFPDPPKRGEFQGIPGLDKFYLLLPCEEKSAYELANDGVKGWLPSDEHDDAPRNMNELQVQLEYHRQQRIRDSLCGGDIPPTHDETAAYLAALLATVREELDESFPPVLLDIIVSYTTLEPRPPPNIDWNFMSDLLNGTLFQRELITADDLSLDHIQPRSILLFTPHSGRWYVNAGADIQSDVEETALSPFPNKEYPTYRAYYLDRWASSVNIQHPHLRLLAAFNFTLTPIQVLQPQPLSHKKKQQQEPILKLLPDATFSYIHISANWLFLLRLMPAILHRLEMDFLHAELSQILLPKCCYSSPVSCSTRLPIQPYVLRQSLTSGNGQETFPLPVPEDEPGSVQQLKVQSHDIDSFFALFQSLQLTPNTVAPTTSIPPFVFSYERLKFLGDSVLKLLLTRILLAEYPNEAEEGITRQKGTMIHMNRMAQYGMQFGLEKYIIAYPFHPANGYRPPGTPLDLSSLPQISPHVLADVVSSLVGAAWISGAEACALQMMCALGILRQEQLARISTFYCLSENVLASFQNVPRVGALLNAESTCEEVIQYKFHHRALYVQVFTHERWMGSGITSTGMSDASGTHTPKLPSYERLELLGDAVLELCVSSWILAEYTRCTGAGELTFLRQKLVSNQVLANAMRKSQLQSFVEFNTAVSMVSIQSSAPKLLADVFEALLGAIYIDSNYQLSAVWAVFNRFVHFTYISDTLSPKLYTHT
jgi:dsRNA-specific ribonuclease